MSICPSPDIHSVYVDGELPEKFLAEYLSHISDCPECKKTLDRLKKMRGVFADDITLIKISDEKAIESYKKLETLLKFKKVSNQSDVFSKYKTLAANFTRIAVAAAILAAVLPFGISKIKSTQQEIDLAYENLGIESPFKSADFNLISSNSNESLLDSTESLRNVELEHILEKHAKSNANPFACGIPPINDQNSQFINFPNVYNNENNLYNVSYSHLLGRY